MNIFKKFTLILSIACIASSAHGMEPEKTKQSCSSRFLGLIRNIALSIMGQQTPAVKTDYEFLQPKAKEKRFGISELKSSLVSLLDEAGLTDITADVDTKIDSFISNDCAHLQSFDFHKWTPLHFAALFDRVEIARTLLVQEEAKDSLSEDNETPLHMTAQTGALEVAQLLLSRGANPNAQNYWGETPLHVALNEQQVAMLPILLAHGGRVNVFDADHKTPIYRAIENGDVLAVRCMFEHALFSSVQELTIQKMMCNRIRERSIDDTANRERLDRIIEEVVTKRLSSLKRILQDPMYMQLAKKYKNPMLHNLVDSKNVEQYRARIQENVRVLLLGENR